VQTAAVAGLFANGLVTNTYLICGMSEQGLLPGNYFFKKSCFTVSLYSIHSRALTFDPRFFLFFSSVSERAAELDQRAVGGAADEHGEFF
jgi:hypothetical protein